MNEGWFLLGHFAKRTAFFAEVDNNADTSTLCSVDAFLDSIGKIWLASTNVRSEDVRTIT
jgi:hypothetical protein